MRSFLISMLVSVALFRPAFAKLSREDVASKIREHLSEVTDCYTPSVQKGQPGEGRVAIDFVFNDIGKVIQSSINAERTTLKNPSLHSCLIKAIESWEFPKAPKGENVRVSYPFDFRKKAQ